MKFANAMNLDRISGGAKRRDLRSALVEKRNPISREDSLTFSEFQLSAYICRILGERLSGHQRTPQNQAPRPPGDPHFPRESIAARPQAPSDRLQYDETGKSP